MKVLMTTLSTVLFALAASVGAARATTLSQGQLTVQGTLTAAGCRVEDKLVALPRVNTGALSARGAVAGKTPFTLNITGCDGTYGVRIYFDREQASIDRLTGRLNNTSPAGAGNVQLEVLNADDGAVDLAAASGAQNTGGYKVGENLSFAFSVQYHATGAASAGRVGSTLVYLLEYN